MAVDDKGGISRDGSMPWPKNSSDLKWFKKKYLKCSCYNGQGYLGRPIYAISFN